MPENDDSLEDWNVAYISSLKKVTNRGISLTSSKCRLYGRLLVESTFQHAVNMRRQQKIL